MKLSQSLVENYRLPVRAHRKRLQQKKKEFQMIPPVKKHIRHHFSTNFHLPLKINGKIKKYPFDYLFEWLKVVHNCFQIKNRRNHHISRLATVNIEKCKFRSFFTETWEFMKLTP